MIRYLFYILTFLSFNITAQETRRDSMEQLLRQNIADTTRINVLIETAKMYSASSDKDKGDSLFKSALSLSRDIEQIEYKVKIYEALGHRHLQNWAFDSAIINYQEALKLDKTQDHTSALARHHDNIGTAFYYKGDYNNTLYHFLKRLSYCEVLGDSSCISAASNNSGLALIELGRYEEAIDYTLRSLKIDETLGNQQGILSSQMSLGNIHFHLKNYDKAIDYQLDVIATSKAMGNQELRTAYAYNNLASIYFQQKTFEKAATFYKKSLELETKFGNKNGIALKYNNLGAVYKELGDMAIAERYYRKALQMREDLGDLYGVSSTENNLGQLYLVKDVPSKALQYYQSALQHAQEAGSLEALKIAHEGIAKAYKKQGLYQLSLQYYERFLALNDSLLNAEKATKIAEIEARYDSEKKANEIVLLKKTEELQQAQLAQQEASLHQSRQQRNLLFIGVAVLLIVFLLVLYTYKQRLAARDLIEKNQRETEEIRTRFFASISHEFRTPLTLISAPVLQLQKKYHHEKDTYGMLGLVHQNAKRLLKLINQILDLSKLKDGKLNLQVEHDDIISWLRIISGTFESLADSKAITYKQRFPTGEIKTFFDKERVEQVCSNLLSNAIKFTPNGGRVDFLVTRDKDELRIDIKNTGSYISKLDQTKIFERFYQTDSQQHSQGTGIGLALVKELTELHHGEVSVSSDTNNTTFSVVLPLNDSAYTNDIKIKTKADTSVDRETVIATSEITEIADSNPSDLPIILLAEDNKDMRRYVGKQLATQYSVKEAQNGRLAWELAVKDIPDLIVTDLMMPEMNGEALLGKLRADPKTQHIPVIMLTARTEQDSKLNNISKGADHYLTKPFEIEELRVRIKSLLEQRKRIRDYHKSQFLANPKVEDITSSNDRFLQKVGNILSKNLDNSAFSVDEFAAEMSMSRVQLYRKMKAIIGYSTSDFIRQYRLKKAYEYLLHKKGTVSEIAYDVGFNNLSYFTKAFKEVYTMTPSEVMQQTN
ncbi:MAG: tetratricopeptide repeat protein [Bacteroidota bacterium]